MSLSLTTYFSKFVSPSRFHAIEFNCHQEVVTDDCQVFLRLRKLIVSTGRITQQIEDIYNLAGLKGPTKRMLVGTGQRHPLEHRAVSTLIALQYRTSPVTTAGSKIRVDLLAQQ